MLSNMVKHESIRILSFLRNRKWSYLIGLFAQCTIMAAQPIIFSFVLKSMADSAVEGDMTILTRSSILFCIFIVCFSLIMPAASYLLQWTVKQVMMDIRLHLFSHIQKLPIPYFEQNHSGDTISRMNNDVQSIEQYFSENFQIFILMIFYGVSSGVTMFMLDWRFALVLILIAIVAVLVNQKIAAPLRSINDKILDQMSILTEKLTDLLAGIQVTKMFRIKSLITSRYKTANDVLTSSMKREGSFPCVARKCKFFYWIHKFYRYRWSRYVNGIERIN